MGTGTLNGETRAFLLTPNPDATDTTPPKLSLSGDIAQEAASADGAEVTFTATATDEEPKEPAVVCSPASGTNFPLGETVIHRSATDAAGNRAEGGFKVTVRDTTAPDTAIESGPDGPKTTPLGIYDEGHTSSATPARSGQAMSLTYRAEASPGPAR